MSYRLDFGRRFLQGGAAAATARALSAAVFSVAFSAAQTAEARTITVDLFNERAAGQVGQCTLREAVAAVNANTAIQGCKGPDGKPDIIHLLPGTYTVRLTSIGDTLTLARAVSIEGNGFERTTLTTSGGGFPMFAGNTSGITLRGIKFGNLRGEAVNVTATGVVSLYDSHIVSSGVSSSGSGVILNRGSMVVSGVEISRCSGWNAGAITNLGWLYIDNSSVLESDSSRNGAIVNDGPLASLYVYNTTLSKNTAGQHATALSNTLAGKTELTAVTIVDNKKREGTPGKVPAIRNTGGTLKIKNSLIARNISEGAPCSGSITSLGYNYLGETEDRCTTANAEATDTSGGGGVHLSALQRVGGLSRVLVPLNVNGNPILRYIPANQCGFADQRGLRRADFGAACEIGAVNRGHATLVVGNAATPATEDTNQKTMLETAGFDTLLVDDNSSAPVLNGSGRSLAIISTTVNDTTIGAKYKSSPIGIVVNRAAVLDNMGMVPTNAYGTFPTARDVAVPFDGEYFHHKIGNFPSRINEGGGGWGTPESTATWMVYYVENTQPAVFRYGKGVQGTGGFVMPAGRISFPGAPSFFNGSATADGKEIFLEAVMWASRAK
jgi:hypothetical protein